MPDPYLALDRLDRHMSDAFLRIDFKLAYHRQRGDNDQILKLKARGAKLARAFDFERARITARIKRLEQGPVVHKKRNRR